MLQQILINDHYLKGSCLRIEQKIPINSLDQLYETTLFNFGKYFYDMQIIFVSEIDSMNLMYWGGGGGMSS